MNLICQRVDLSKKATKKIPDDVAADLKKRLREALEKDKSHTKKLTDTD